MSDSDYYIYVGIKDGKINDIIWSDMYKCAPHMSEEKTKKVLKAYLKKAIKILHNRK